MSLCVCWYWTGENTGTKSSQQLLSLVKWIQRYKEEGGHCGIIVVSVGFWDLNLSKRIAFTERTCFVKVYISGDYVKWICFTEECATAPASSLHDAHKVCINQEITLFCIFVVSHIEIMELLTPWLSVILAMLAFTLYTLISVKESECENWNRLKSLAQHYRQGSTSLCFTLWLCCLCLQRALGCTCVLVFCLFAWLTLSCSTLSSLHIDSEAFARWKQQKEEKGFNDADVAVLLLNR